ncbi:MAG: peptidylprolyl isomerase [Deltaproteobacteria bacterium RBG_13_52_11]|nr:MAG: peptidylprolyl isomerase [Deltaproteobacteria bacterium RBG_13_52_11]
MPKAGKTTAKAKEGDIVKVHYKVHYTGKLKDESIFDSSQGGEPLEITLGSEQVIPGFEKAMIGMSAGDSKTFEIVAEEAYGLYREELLVKIDKEQIPDDLRLEPGQELVLRQAEGPPIRVTVADMSGQSVTLDANHPLAGEDLTFEVQLLEIISES